MNAQTEKEASASNSKKEAILPISLVELSSDQRAFHLEEFKTLRTEVLGILAQVDSVVRYTLLTAAVVFSWLATQGVGIEPATPGPAGHFCAKLPQNLLGASWMIPTAFSVLSAIWIACAMARVGQMGGYLRNLEGQLGYNDPAVLGWEAYVRHSLPSMKIFLGVLGILILVGTAAIGGFGACTMLGMSVCPPGK